MIVMGFVALIRKLNAGSENRIKKEDLWKVFDQLNLQNIQVYINSGNVIFDSGLKEEALKIKIENALSTHFSNKIEIVIYNKTIFEKIVTQIPAEWKNNEKERTDVAFLFENIDNAKILNELPVNKEYIEVMYVRRALIWNLKRVNLNKSRLGKLIGSEFYRNMTIRNVNTVRELFNMLRNT
jgi:uncharacterized protein (DUF1697 family)